MATTRDGTIVDLQRAITVLKLELDTAGAERDAAVAREAALAEGLNVINCSPGDTAPVFAAILEKAHSLCGADLGALSIYDGTQVRSVATLGYSEQAASLVRLVAGPSPIQRALNGGARCIHIPDVRAVEFAPVGDIARRLSELTGLRTYLIVPLRKDGTLLGHIAAHRLEVCPFVEHEIALLESFAVQAVIAIENARLITEQREALEQQTATAEVLQVINASPGDLQPVFDTMLEKAMRLCRAAMGGIYTYDGESFQTAALRGVPAAYAEFRAINPPTGVPGGPPARLLETKRPVHVPDLMDEEIFQSGHTGALAFVDLGGVRALLNVPLLKDEAVLGLIAIYRHEPGAFSDRQIALLENFAAQAVIAMESARLLTEQREALDQQTATAEVLQVINASPGDLLPVFETMLEKALRLCGGTMGGIFMFDGDHSVTSAVRGVTADFEQYNNKYPMDKIQPGTLPARIIETSGPVQYADVTASEPYRAGRPYARALVELGGIRATLAVPLLKDSVAVGMVAIYRQEAGAFSDKQIVLLQNFAAQAVIAMENARLLTEQREALEQQTATAEVLQVINASPGNLQPVFDVIVEKGMLLCEAGVGSLYTYDGERFHSAAQRGVPPAYAAYRAENPPTLVPGSGTERVLETKQPRHVLDLKAGHFYREGYAHARAMVDLGGIRTLLSVPLVKDDVFLGYISVLRQEVRAFSDQQIALLQNFAAQAVIAMENARLLGELHTALNTTQATLRELKAAQANLIQAEKMASLGQLTAGIAHEIKNPLNFVNNFAELSVDLLGELKHAIAPAEPALTDDQRADIDDVSAMLTSNLEKITEHGKRADAIVKAMLEHSRGSSAERRMLDLNALIDEALNLSYHGARAQDQSFNITLERDFDAGIAPIEVNPQDMTRVFLNIFSNGFYAATKRARSGGDAEFVPMLTVATRDAGEAVEIRVRDNGTGIPPDIRDKLFQPFFTTKPTGEGTGLGLSITYDIVTKQHGGTITVDSEVDAFTEFVVTLPRQMFTNGGSRA